MAVEQSPTEKDNLVPDFESLLQVHSSVDKEKLFSRSLVKSLFYFKG